MDAFPIHPEIINRNEYAIDSSHYPVLKQEETFTFYSAAHIQKCSELKMKLKWIKYILQMIFCPVSLYFSVLGKKI